MLVDSFVILRVIDRSSYSFIDWLVYRLVAKFIDNLKLVDDVGFKIDRLVYDFNR